MSLAKTEGTFYSTLLTQVSSSGTLKSQIIRIEP